MTRISKEEIINLRKEGFSYSKIATALCISENTVKSFCRRNNLGRVFAAVNSDKQDGHFCRQCGKPRSGWGVLGQGERRRYARQDQGGGIYLRFHQN